MKQILTVILVITSCLSAKAQIKWHNPQSEGAHVHGQALPLEARTNFYQRLPDRVKGEVRADVWYLSLQAAGESLKFHTNSPQIVVRYTLTEGHSMPHMSAIGKSGVDLYAYDQSGRERWCGAPYNFADTVTFNYQPLTYQDSAGYEFRLTLPPYNSVKWLEIGVDSSSSFRFIDPSDALPIIAYGTSITQGACASRPSMIWTEIVSRELRTPLINLGFSGNGQLEKGILDVIKATPACAVILDCMPNLATLSVDSLKTLLTNAIVEIRSSQPEVPIIVADHLGYPHTSIVGGRENQVENTIEAQKTVCQELVAGGDRNLYYLSYDEIAMPQDGTVEGIHPSDYGMRVYADAYVARLRKVLKLK